MSKTTVLSKSVMVVLASLLACLCALIASLPLNKPNHQHTSDISGLDPGDSAWMMVASTAALFLGPAEAELYTNVYGRSRQRALRLTLLTSAVISVLWVVVSFSLCFGVDANGQGLLGFPSTFYLFRGVGAAPLASLSPTAPGAVFAAFELGTALIAPAVTACLLADRVSAPGFLLFAAAWHLGVYCPLAHLLWGPGGWAARHQIEDFAGAVPVHLLAACGAAVGEAWLNYTGAPAARPWFVRDHRRVLGGTAVVWALSACFIAGKAHDAGVVAAQAVANVAATSGSAVFAWFLLDRLRGAQFTTLSIFGAVVAALAAASASAGFVTVGGAMVIGALSAAVTQALARAARSVGCSAPGQPLSVAIAHGGGSATGFIAVAALSYTFVNPSAYNGLTFGRHSPMAAHLIALLVLWPGVALATGLCYALCGAVLPLRRAPRGASSLAAVDRPS